MILTINNKEMELADDQTILGFLEEKQLQPRSVVVEVNRVIIERDKYAEHVLKEGDVVEMVRFIGGG